MPSLADIKRGVRRFAARSSGRPAVPHYTVVPGAAANTNIPVPGLTLRDQLLSVLEWQPPSAASGNTLTDRTSVASIHSDGNIRLTVATTGNQLLVFALSVSS